MKIMTIALLFIFGCSVNLDIRFPKPKEESCEKDCEIYLTFQGQWFEWEDRPHNKDPYCTCMDDCMDGADYDWEKQCPRWEDE